MANHSHKNKNKNKNKNKSFKTQKGGMIGEIQFKPQLCAHENDCGPSVLFDLGYTTRETSCYIADFFPVGIKPSFLILLFEAVHGTKYVKLDYLFEYYEDRNNNLSVQHMLHMLDLLGEHSLVIALISVTDPYNIEHYVVLYEVSGELFVRDSQSCYTSSFVVYLYFLATENDNLPNSISVTIILPESNIPIKAGIPLITNDIVDRVFLEHPEYPNNENRGAVKKNTNLTHENTCDDIHSKIAQYIDSNPGDVYGLRDRYMFEHTSSEQLYCVDPNMHKLSYSRPTDQTLPVHIPEPTPTPTRKKRKKHKKRKRKHTNVSTQSKHART